jgi:hypothetical protein
MNLPGSLLADSDEAKSAKSETEKLKMIEASTAKTKLCDSAKFRLQSVNYSRAVRDEVGAENLEQRNSAVEFLSSS